ncbi:MAG: exodeoxyribonuclease VII large subunit [Azospirillum sp.]|nr:exodeoxyribonuclease VII large subunit [Azospirillum sp.]
MIPGSNLPEFTVGELARALKRTVEDAYGFVRVRGEISQPKRHSSGHLYLRLKDAEAVIEAVCWRGAAGRLAVRPEEGLEVICSGRLTTYPGRSQYQLIIESMELAGEGALLKMLEERKRRLAAEGLFDAARKRKLPYLPTVIGVITSPTGAVIRDILHRLADRFPRHVLLWPVAVQGEQSAVQVAAAIAGFNRLDAGGPVPRPDLLIVARGGGSLEDLMPFNEEIVVRAAATSVIPLISAVGHETDTTLIDLAADLRAPTPTAAAELAVPVRVELVGQVLDFERRQFGAFDRLIAQARTRLEGLGRGLGDPRALIEERSQRLDDRAERLQLAVAALVERSRTRLAPEARALGGALRQAVQAALNRCDRVAARLSLAPLRRRLDDAAARVHDLGPRLDRAADHGQAERAAKLRGLGQLLESYSYRGVLARGFVLVTDRDRHPVTAAAQAHGGQAVTLAFHDGDIAAVIGGTPPRSRPTTKRGAAKDSQGTLL